MTRIIYRIEVHPDIAKHAAEFSSRVHFVLNDPRGWKKYGFEFVPLGDNQSSQHDRILSIELQPVGVTGALCGTQSLSCYRSRDHRVVINFANWMGNSQMSKDGGMMLEEYRTYVINHEVGHSLSLEHPKFYDPARVYTGELAKVFPPGYTQCDPALKGKPGSVMMQMSRGLEFISPCLPNCWPLDPAQYDEFASKTKRRSNGWIMLVLTLLVLICVWKAQISINSNSIQNSSIHHIATRPDVIS